MKDPIVKGHPLHAMLTDLPVGATATGVAFDLIGGAIRVPQWRFAATACFGAAFVTGGLAAAVGYWDYRSMPKQHPAHRTGGLHGYINAGAVAVLGLALAMRARDLASPDTMSVDTQANAARRILPLLALTLLGPSGWLGGDIVFAKGWRVRPAEHAEQLEQSLRASGEGARIEPAHAAAEQYEREHALIP